MEEEAVVEELVSPSIHLYDVVRQVANVNLICYR